MGPLNRWRLHRLWKRHKNEILWLIHPCSRSTDGSEYEFIPNPSIELLTEKPRLKSVVKGKLTFWCDPSRTFYCTVNKPLPQISPLLLFSNAAQVRELSPHLFRLHCEKNWISRDKECINTPMNQRVCLKAHQNITWDFYSAWRRISIPLSQQLWEIVSMTMMHFFRYKWEGAWKWIFRYSSFSHLQAMRSSLFIMWLCEEEENYLICSRDEVTICILTCFHDCLLLSCLCI